MEVDDVEVSTQCELRRNRAGQSVRREVKHGEIDKRLKLRRDRAGDEVGRQIEGLEIGAVGEERSDGATEREVGEGELVDAAIVASGALEIRSEAATWVCKGGFGPVL